jgi:hypothetical protein
MTNRRILNLGAGTQSSVLLVMHDRGELPPVDVAIFSDTQAGTKFSRRIWKSDPPGCLRRR